MPLWKWIAFASSSFPVPLSPYSRTVVSVCATREAISVTSCMARDPAIMFSKENRSATTSRRRRFSCFNAATSSDFSSNDAKLLARERFGQVVEGATFHRINGRGNCPVRRQHDDREIRLQGLQPGEQFHAVHLRHLHIGQDQVDLARPETAATRTSRSARSAHDSRPPEAGIPRPCGSSDHRPRAAQFEGRSCLPLQHLEFRPLGGHVERQANSNTRAAMRGAMHLDIPPMRHDDPMGDGETKTSALLSGREERTEDVIQVLRWDPGPLIDDIDDCLLAIRQAFAHTHARVRWAHLNGVQEHIQQHLLDLQRVDKHGRRSFDLIDFQPYTGLLTFDSNEGDHSLHKLVQRVGTQIRHRVVAHIEETPRRGCPGAALPSSRDARIPIPECPDSTERR